MKVMRRLSFVEASPPVRDTVAPPAIAGEAGAEDNREHGTAAAQNEVLRHDDWPHEEATFAAFAVPGNRRGLVLGGSSCGHS
jgi:hypothetical protein